MAAETPILIPVATRIESDLRDRLTAKRHAADRSEAAEIRQAIRAWVDEDAETLEPVVTGATEEMS